MILISVFNLNMRAAVQVVQSPQNAAVLLQPGRLDLLKNLEKPDSAAGLARRLGVPRQKLNYHLRELERAGFLQLVEERRKGNCMERRVRASAQSYLLGPQITGPPAEVHDRFSVAYLVAAAAQVIRDVAGLAGRARRAGKRLATLTMEADIRFASAQARNAFAEELAHMLAGLAAKYHDEQAAGGRRFRVLAAAYPAASARPESENSESVNME